VPLSVQNRFCISDEDTCVGHRTSSVNVVLEVEFGCRTGSVLDMWGVEFGCRTGSVLDMWELCFNAEPVLYSVLTDVCVDCALGHHFKRNGPIHEEFRNLMLQRTPTSFFVSFPTLAFHMSLPARKAYNKHTCLLKKDSQVATREFFYSGVRPTSSL
jgi:hypothetical protein